MCRLDLFPMTVLLMNVMRYCTLGPTIAPSEDIAPTDKLSFFPLLPKGILDWSSLKTIWFNQEVKNHDWGSRMILYPWNDPCGRTLAGVSEFMLDLLRRNCRRGFALKYWMLFSWSFSYYWVSAVSVAIEIKGKQTRRGDWESLMVMSQVGDFATVDLFVERKPAHASILLKLVAQPYLPTFTIHIHSSI